MLDWRYKCIYHLAKFQYLFALSIYYVTAYQNKSIYYVTSLHAVKVVFKGLDNAEHVISILSLVYIKLEANVKWENVVNFG